MRKVIFLLLFPVLGVLLLAGVGVTAAGAATTDDCQAKINALVTQTQSATFYGGQAEGNRADLLIKLDEASEKLAEGKLDDAVQKLTDFRTSVQLLASATKPKIDAEDAAALIAGADDAIACIQSLQATATAPPTSTDSATATPTSTDSATAPPTASDTATPAPTATATPTSTDTATATATPTSTDTATATP
jgi:hypothetical protein